MTANSGISVTVLLSVLCLGIVMMFVGGWYFQSSLVELRVMVANQHEYIVEQKKEIMGQRNEILAHTVKATKREDIIQQLQEALNEQNKNLNELLLQLQNSKFQVRTMYKHHQLIACARSFDKENENRVHDFYSFSNHCYI